MPPRRRRSRRLSRRTGFTLMTAVVIAMAVIWALTRLTRPRRAVPFRFPTAAVTTPTAEIGPTEQAELDALLRRLQRTPASSNPAPR